MSSKEPQDDCSKNYFAARKKYSKEKSFDELLKDSLTKTVGQRLDEASKFDKIVHRIMVGIVITIITSVLIATSS